MKYFLLAFLFFNQFAYAQDYCNPPVEGDLHWADYAYTNFEQPIGLNGEFGGDCGNEIITTQTENEFFEFGYAYVSPELDTSSGHFSKQFSIDVSHLLSSKYPNNEVTIMSLDNTDKNSFSYKNFDMTLKKHMGKRSTLELWTLTLNWYTADNQSQPIKVEKVNVNGEGVSGIIHVRTEWTKNLMNGAQTNVMLTSSLIDREHNLLKWIYNEQNSNGLPIQDSSNPKPSSTVFLHSPFDNSDTEPYDLKIGIIDYQYSLPLGVGINILYH